MNVALILAAKMTHDYLSPCNYTRKYRVVTSSLFKLATVKLMNSAQLCYDLSMPPLVVL